VGIAHKPASCCVFEHLCADVLPVDFDGTQEPPVGVAVRSVDERDELDRAATDEPFQQRCGMAMPAFVALGGIELGWPDALDGAIGEVSVKGVSVDDP
jgi:hypothetical protein